VLIVPKHLNNAIASDDLIRVIIPDENLRHYVYCYLLSKQAQDQLLRNEYGSIQQHLESIHVSNLLVPVPEDMSKIEMIINQSKATLIKKEEAYDSSVKADTLLQSKMREIISNNE
jgi:restriction endonuclease S subunit